MGAGPASRLMIRCIWPIGSVNDLNIHRVVPHVMTLQPSIHP